MEDDGATAGGDTANSNLVVCGFGQESERGWWKVVQSPLAVSICDATSSNARVYSSISLNIHARSELSVGIEDSHCHGQ